MKTILVVDDDPDILLVIEAVLQEAGLRPMGFTEPQAAFDAACRSDIDAVVLDVMMPGLSGFDLLAKMQKEPATRSLPVLFLSALDTAPDRIRGLRQGADDYLGKPFTPEELVLRLERILERRAAEPKPPRVDGEDRKMVGRYQIRGVLGEGAMGTVYRGWDPKLEREVALKTVRPELAEDLDARGKLVTQLLQEAVMVAGFSHPNIVAVYDVGDAPEAAFIAMELVEGPSLHTYLNKVGRMRPAQVVSLTLQIAQALSVAHAREMVHRDVKPGNILLTPDGIAKVTDFGLARRILAVTHDARHVIGTPGFLAPEVLLGQGYSKSSDLFSLGAILYRCLTGEWAFPGLTINEVVASTLKGVSIAPSCLVPDLPPALDDLVMRLLEVDLKARLTSADEIPILLDGLDQALPVPAAFLTPTEPLPESQDPAFYGHSVALHTVSTLDAE